MDHSNRYVIWNRSKHMNSRNGLYLLTGLNVVLLAVLLAQQLQPAFAQGGGR